MRSAARLRRSSDIATVRSAGRTVRGGAFTARILPNTLGEVRLAVTAPRTVGGSVVRNRARRRVREAFRRASAGARPADLVVTVRRDALTMDFAALARAAATTLAEIGG